MSCRKAFEVDIIGFLAEAGRPEFASFREHYPRCPECAAEVRAWTDLHVLLQARGSDPDGAHPEPALLLEYAQRNSALDAAGRSDLQRHLAACASCRDELNALHHFDFSGLAAARPAAAAARRAARGLWPAVRGIALHPAFAYALVLLLLYPAVTGVFERSRLPGLADLAERAERPQPAAPEAEMVASDDREAGGRLGQLAKRHELLREAPAAPPRAAGPSAREAPRLAPAERETDSFLSDAAAGDEASEPEPEIAYHEEVQLEALARRELQARPPVPSPAFALKDAAKQPAFRLGRGPLGPVLYVRVPEALRRAPGVEVRVRIRGGRQELRSRFAASELAPELPIQLPPDYAAVGRSGTWGYEVEVLRLEAAAGAGTARPR